MVTAVRAEYHLSQNRAELAAKYMAQMPFADTAIRLALPMLGNGFSEAYSHNSSPNANKALASSNMALITFLTDKMQSAKSNQQSSSMVLTTMLGTWLTELHLQEREKDTTNGHRPVSSPSGKQKHQLHDGTSVNHALLHQFLSSFVRDMDPNTIIQVLASHDISAGECAGYSAAAGEIGAAIHAALSRDDEKVSHSCPAMSNQVREGGSHLGREPYQRAPSVTREFVSCLTSLTCIVSFLSVLPPRKEWRS